MDDVEILDGAIEDEFVQTTSAGVEGLRDGVDVDVVEVHERISKSKLQDAVEQGVVFDTINYSINGNSKNVIYLDQPSSILVVISIKLDLLTFFNSPNPIRYDMIANRIQYFPPSSDMSDCRRKLYYRINQ